MYSNMKYYENICNCLRVIQQDINRKLKSANCWQQTSLKLLVLFFNHEGYSCVSYEDINVIIINSSPHHCEETATLKGCVSKFHY